LIIDPTLLKTLLRYEPETGKLYWLSRSLNLFKDVRGQTSWNTRYAGHEAFTSIDSRGYKQGNLFNRLYRAHRIIWALVTGSWPKNCIDHKDGDTLNNRWDNLREATFQENSRNTSSHKDSSSKYLGVHYEKHTKKWRAAGRAKGKRVCLGRYTSEVDAAKAYDNFARDFYGDFANLNFTKGKHDRKNTS
jgi:hypothetical protein